MDPKRCFKSLSLNFVSRIRELRQEEARVATHCAMNRLKLRNLHPPEKSELRSTDLLEKFLLVS